MSQQNSHPARARSAPRPRPSRALLWVAAVFAVAPTSAMAAFDVVEATITDLHAAYRTGRTTAVEVVQQYIDRINTFDKKGTRTSINSVAAVSADALAQAAAIDARRAAGETLASIGPMAGVPVLFKDSYDVRGMVTTNGVSVLNGSGTPGSTTLVAKRDAFNVAQMRDAGAIILGKAAMSTMAYSYNGIDNAHGVVLNPYSPTRQPGGSSSGSGVSVAANMAMVAMGGETGGSIRVPANHNALVGLKTSVGLIDPGGTFPLSPARDVVGPLAKSVSDAAIMMNALVGPSTNNLFNDTPFYPTADPGTVRPADYTRFLDDGALSGKVVAVPRSMYNVPGKNYEGNVHPLILSAFNDALGDIRKQGATVVFVDIPAADTYYTTIARPNSAGGPTTVGFGYDYPTTTPGGTTPSGAWSNMAAAFYYDELIKQYDDPTIRNLADFATALERGADAGAGDRRSPLGTRNPTTGVYTGAAGNIRTLANLVAAGNAKGFGDANGDGVLDNPDARRALQAFQNLRLDQFEDFMADPDLVDDPSTVGFDESRVARIDAFVAPTFGDRVPLQTAILPAGTADPFAIPDASTPNPNDFLSFASLLGRLESNILGAPAISVPMGYLSDGTPMGIQFFNQLLGEGNLLGYAFDYEQATLWRRAPDLANLVNPLVPEPATLAVVASGAILVLRRRRVTHA